MDFEKCASSHGTWQRASCVLDKSFGFAGSAARLEACHGASEASERVCDSIQFQFGRPVRKTALYFGGTKKRFKLWTEKNRALRKRDSGNYRAVSNKNPGEARGQNEDIETANCPGTRNAYAAGEWLQSRGNRRQAQSAS